MNKNFLNNFVVLIPKSINYFSKWNVRNMRGKILERTDLVLLESKIEAVFSHAIIFQTQTPPHPAKTDIKKGRLAL